MNLVSFRAAGVLLTGLYITLPPDKNFVSWGLRKLSSNFLNDMTGGATEGVATGAADGVVAALRQIGQDFSKNIDFKKFGEKFPEAWKDFTAGVGYQQGGAGQNAGDTLSKEWASFWAGTGMQQGDFGQKLGETLSKEWANLATSSGADPVLMAGKLSKLMQDIMKNFNAGAISGTAADQMNDAFDTFFDTFDFAEKNRRLAEEVRRSMEQSTFELGKGARQGIFNTVGEVVKGVTLDILPWVLGGMAAVIATPLATYYLYRKALHNIGRPKLATEVHQRTIITPLTERVKSAASFVFRAKQKKPIFSPEITRRIEELSAATQNIRKNGGYFQNVLFYGPGGTGKTMISDYIAKNSGMSYVKMSGGDLAQYIKRGEHVTELNKLLDKMNTSWRPWSSRPWVLFIDEAESLCRDRSKIPTSELLELQNALLNRTGTESDKFMMILSTNRMEDLDEAILSRMDHKVHIGPPAEAERVRILHAYIPHFFSRSEQAEFFMESQVLKIAKTTEGLTGRALFKLLNALSNKKATTDNRKLTQPMIEQSIKDMVEQEKEVEKRRALKEAELGRVSTLGRAPGAAPRPVRAIAPNAVASNREPKTFGQRFAGMFN